MSGARPDRMSVRGDAVGHGVASDPLPRCYGPGCHSRLTLDWSCPRKWMLRGGNLLTTTDSMFDIDASSLTLDRQPGSEGAFVPPRGRQCIAFLLCDRRDIASFAILIARGPAEPPANRQIDSRRRPSLRTRIPVALIIA